MVEHIHNYTFLEELMNKNRIRDPVHGFIRFSDREKAVLDSPQMQRLKNIKQLAFTYYVYPGAMHSRFEHSLGVMYLAGLIFQCISLNSKELMDEALKNMLDADKVLEIIRLAALLHDIGHLPFSHSGEAVLPDNKRHEDVSVEMILEMKNWLDNLYFSGATELVVKLLIGNIPPELKFLADILAGQVDADRIDYLLRDSLHCGVGYGNFDYRRLIECLTVCESDTGIELAIQRGGFHTLEALVLARYYMFTQVYEHRTRRIYDIYLAEVMKQLGFNLTPLSRVVEHDDISVCMNIRAKASEERKQGKKSLATRLISREHHSMIYETSDFADVRDQQIALEIYSMLVEKFPNYEFIIDSNGCGGNIHKFYVDGDEEEGVYFYVVADNGEKKLISEESKIIGKIHKKFRVIRIYTDQKEKDTLQKIKSVIYEGR